MSAARFCFWFVVFGEWGERWSPPVFLFCSLSECFSSSDPGMSCEPARARALLLLASTKVQASKNESDTTNTCSNVRTLDWKDNIFVAKAGVLCSSPAWLPRGPNPPYFVAFPLAVVNNKQLSSDRKRIIWTSMHYCCQQDRKWPETPHVLGEELVVVTIWSR